MKLKQKQTILPPETSQTDFEQELIQYKNRISNILESFTDAFFEVDRNIIICAYSVLCFYSVTRFLYRYHL